MSISMPLLSRSLMLLITGLLVQGSPLSAAQLAASNETAGVGTTAKVIVSYTAQGANAAGLQFDLQYDHTALTVTGAVIGSAASAAGKMLIGPADNPDGSKKFGIAGLNNTAMGDGSVVEISVKVSPSALKGVYTLTMLNTMGTDTTAKIFNITPVNGSVTVPDGAVGPALAITKTHAGNFTQGQTGATYTVTVSNGAGAGGTTSAVTVTDTVPAGLTLVSMAGSGWTCASTTCTRSDALAGGASYSPITVTVNVAPNATSPQVNTAAVAGGGSAGASATDSTIIAIPAPPAPVLIIAKVHSGNFKQGQVGAKYTVAVGNMAAGSTTSGQVTVTESVPAGLTLVSMAGTGWTCGGASCTRSDALAGGGGSLYPPITVTVNVAANAAASVVNSISASGGGSASGATANDPTTIDPNPPVLSITKTHAGSFMQGQTGATYTVTVSDGASAGPTSGMVTVTETVPSGLTLVSMSGAGWTCGGSTCTRSDVLTAGGSYPPITVTVNVGANAASPQVNAVSVSGGGSAGAAATDSTVIGLPPPALGITKTHTGNFMQGQLGAAYMVTVSNAAAAGPTSGTVTVAETVPPGLTLVSMAGTGWTCPAATASCTRGDALAGGASYPPVVVTVNVAANATSPQVNVATVSGGASSTATAMDSTMIQTPPPSGILLMMGNGSAAPGQSIEVPMRLTILSGPSPAGFQADVSFDPQKLTYVSARKGEALANAGKDVSAQLQPNNDERLTAGVNQNTISNGNVVYVTFQVNSQFTSGLAAITLKNCQAVDPQAVPLTTTCAAGIISPMAPNSAVLSVSKTHVGNFTQGQTGAYTVTVGNGAGAGPTIDTVTVTDAIPSGLTLVSMGGAGWQCPGTAANNCSRTDTLSGGQSYPPITVMVTVGASASTPQVNAVTVSGGGSANAGASDPATILVPPSGLILPGNVTLGPGDFAVFPVTLATPAPAGGVFVTLTSSNTAAVTVRPANVFIPALQTQSLQPKVTGVDVGSAIITASASNLPPASQVVVVIPNRTIAFSPPSLSITGNATRNLTLNLLGGNAPDAGLVINLSSSNPGVATVPSTVRFTPGTNTIQVRVSPAGPGSAVIHASALPDIADTTASVTVQGQGVTGAITQN